MIAKRKILFILHLPPPIHGASIMGTFYRDSKLINSTFDTSYINLSTAGTLEDMGKADIKKILRFIELLLIVTRSLMNKQVDLCYMTLNATGSAFYKDLFVVAILKLFRKKIIYQFHNKGIEPNSNRKLNALLYRFAFRNTTSILTSRFLYYDIKSFVKEENIYYLPNGIPRNKEITNAEQIGQDVEQVCRLLFLSNIISEKGVFVLIEACGILKERKLKFHCDFVGAWGDVTEDEFE
ncbi:MAG: glycosyltransferase family 1 protein, partial [Segetibacter sp.]